MICRIFLSLLCLTILLPAPLFSAEKAESFRREEKREVDELLEVFNIIFGSAPPMATERGTLLIEAYLDLNGNRTRDPGEEELSEGIVCRLDGIDYSLPAFIPGLDYNGAYDVRCSGEGFASAAGGRSFLVRKRGEIIRLDLPFRLAPTEGEKP